MENKDINIPGIIAVLIIAAFIAYALLNFDLTPFYY